MENLWFWIGSIIAALLLLALAAIIIFGFGRVAVGIVMAFFDERRRRAEEVTVAAPVLGSIRYCGTHMWAGEFPQDSAAPGIDVILEGPPDSPPFAQCEQAATLAAQLPLLEERARPLLDADAAEWNMLPVPAWNLDAMHLQHDPSAFRLDFARDDDPDGIWFVEFKDSQPVASGRDD